MLQMSDWDLVCLLLMQSLLGNISGNVRMITLDYNDDHWTVTTFMESDSRIDRENAEDTVEELGVEIANSQDELSDSGNVRVDSEVVISAGNLEFKPTHTTRVIFRRYEEVAE